MNASNRGFRDKGTHNARHSVMSDGFGNRKTFEEVRIPPDNIGNKLEGEAALDPYIDGLGNSLDDEPSHLKSGILAQVSGPRSYHKRREYSMRPKEAIFRPEPQIFESNAQAGDIYIAQLNQEFSKLFGQKIGLAFSFSKKAIGSLSPSILETAKKELSQTEDLIKYILHENQIPAVVNVINYRTSSHWFSVFFIGPEIDDPARSKEMIAALRQVVNDYTQKMVKSSINIFLVLANAKAVIEEHLLKIGAKKVENDL
jgi:hypothetical protein